MAERGVGTYTSAQVTPANEKNRVERQERLSDDGLLMLECLYQLPQQVAFWSRTSKKGSIHRRKRFK